MKKKVEKCFIENIDEKNVSVYFFEAASHRIFNRDHIFSDFEVFKGKNLTFEVTIIPGTMTMKCIESKRSKFVQLWNYYIRGKF